MSDVVSFVSHFCASCCFWDHRCIGILMKTTCRSIIMTSVHLLRTQSQRDLKKKKKSAATLLSSLLLLCFCCKNLFFTPWGSDTHLLICWRPVGGFEPGNSIFTASPTQQPALPEPAILSDNYRGALCEKPRSAYYHSNYYAPTNTKLHLSRRLH